MRHLLAGLVLSVGLALGSIIGCQIASQGNPTSTASEPSPANQPMAGGKPAQLTPEQELQAGLELFAIACAQCHGPSGRGDGPMGLRLQVRPRDFASGRFKLTSTTRGLPTDDDLLRTLINGMLPSPMPPWRHLPPEYLQVLIRAIRHLAVEGMVADLLADNPRHTRAKARAIAHDKLDPGPLLVLPTRPAKLDIHRGRDLFLANCAVCHDTDGQARLRTDLVDSNDRPIRPRNLMTGPFKGGDTLEALATRIRRGIPGTPMPSFERLSGDDLFHLAAFVQSLKTSQFTPAETFPNAR